MDIKERVESYFRNRKVNFERQNNDNERNYFSLNNKGRNFFMNGKSFNDLISKCKKDIKSSDVKGIMEIMKDVSVLLFYAGDPLFKEKLKSDEYKTVTLKNFICSTVEKEVTEKSDESIKEMIDKYLVINAIFNKLYVNNFKLPVDDNVRFDGVTSKEVLDIVKNNNITIGMYLDSLIDYKFDIVYGLIKNIENEQIKQEFMKAINIVKDQFLNENKESHSYNLNIFYFITHSNEELIVSMPYEKQKTL